MFRILTVLLLATSGCVAANAAPPDSPALTVTQVGDSLRVVAKWSPACDWRGCPDGSRVVWQIGSGFPLIRDIKLNTDTLWAPAPKWGDSASVTVTVVPMRRKIAGTARTATRVVYPADGPPLPVDSLRLDTLPDFATLAESDSFPVIAALDSLGRSAAALTASTDTLEFTLCALARNRYTGAVVIMVPWSIGDAEAARIERTCELARQAYAARRSG